MKKLVLLLSLLASPVYASNVQVYPCFTTTANLLNCLISNYSIVWPAHQGVASTSLINDGSGNLTWGAVAVAGSVVTSISGAGVISVSPPTGAAVVSLTGVVPSANGGTGVDGSAVFPTSGAVVTESATETLANKTLSNSAVDSTGLFFQNASAQAILVTLPASVSGYTFKLPPDGGTNGYFLQTNGSGTTGWVSTAITTVPTASLSGAFVASLAGVAPIVATGTSGAVSITQASTGANGYLSSTDWNTFNSKVGATYPVPTASLSGTVATASLSGSFVSTLSGTAPIVATGTGGAISITQASTGANGYLSSTDWNTFNNKVSATYPIPTASLSGTIATGSLSGVVAIANGGGNANTSQGSINNLSQLTTKGDVEIFNGSNTTRFGVGSDGQVLTASSAATGGLQWLTPAAAGTGTVTSVAFADSGGIFSLSGTPITTSGTITESVTGTSGAVLFFNSTSQVSSSAVLASNGVIIGGGAGVAPKSIAAGSAGQLLVGTSGAPAFGSTVSAATTFSSGIVPGSAQSTLSNYTKRTSFTPAFNGSSSAPSVTYSTQTGYYLQIGDVVFFTAFIQVSAESSSGSGNLLLNLPVSTSYYNQEIPCSYALVTLPSSSDTGLFLEINSTYQGYGTFIAPRNSGVAEDILPTSSVTAGGFTKTIVCTGTYFVQ